MERKEILLIALIAILLLTTAVQAIQLVVLSSNPVVAGSKRKRLYLSDALIKISGFAFFEKASVKYGCITCEIVVLKVVTTPINEYATEKIPTTAVVV